MTELCDSIKNGGPLKKLEGKTYVNEMFNELLHGLQQQSDLITYYNVDFLFAELYFYQAVNNATPKT